MATIPPEELGRFSWKRPLTSYTRVHDAVTRYLMPFIRNRRWLVRKRRWSGKDYLNVGCGYGLYEGFVNLDYIWKPGVLCWDVSRLDKEPLPFADNTFKGIYTEHCLEHIDLEASWACLRDLHRVLKPGGRVRIIVPDGEIYIDGYIAHRAGNTIELPYAKQNKEATPMISINRVGRDAHKFLYDYETLAYMLKETGFSAIKKERFGSGADPFLLRDSKHREWESLYVEAVK